MPPSRYTDQTLVLEGQQPPRINGPDPTASGSHKGESEPWIVIQAVDSTAFDVQSDNNDVIHQIRQQFRSVVDLPSDSE